MPEYLAELSFEGESVRSEIGERKSVIEVYRTQRGPAGFSQHELHYSETTAPYQKVSTTPLEVSPNTLIPGLGGLLIGEGRPVEIEFYAPGIYSSSHADAPLVPFIVINGTTLGAGAQYVRSGVTSDGPAMIMKRRMVLAAGAAYSMYPGIYAMSSGITVNMMASEYSLPYFSVMSR